MVEGGRLTAQRARMADIVAGNLDTSRGAPRVNVIGVVVAVQNESPPSFIVDDRSALMMVRQFDDMIPPAVGAVVCVIGRVRDYGGEQYVASEIIRQLDSKWLEVRNLELAKQSSFSTPVLEKQEVVEDVTDTDTKVLSAIRKLDDGAGAAVEDILSDVGADAERLISMLLQRGDVFEVSPGRIKILE